MTGTTLTHVPLPRPVQAAETEDLERQWVSVSPDLLGLRVDGDAGTVVCACAPGADLTALEGKVARYLGVMLARTKPVPLRVLFQRSVPGCAFGGGSTFDDLRRRDLLTEHGEGAVGFAGAALDVFSGLDSFLRRTFEQRFGAVERRFPTLIPYEILARCGYFDSHPDAASFVTHLHQDFDVISAFRAEQIEEPDRTSPSPSVLAPSERCLCPASCFPCYHAFTERCLPETGAAVTLRGRVFRFETRRLAGLERLWEFNQREIVFLGSPDFIARGRERLVGFFEEIAQDWDLDCTLETASDAFVPEVHVSRTYWQRLTEAKCEFRLPIGLGPTGGMRTVAASSINLHGTFFGERFGISLPDGTPATTACCGWGLERWLLALYARHGFELACWPSHLRLALDL